MLATPITIKKTKRRAAEMSTCATVVETENAPATPTQNPDESEWLYNIKASKRPNPGDAAVASQTFRVHEFVSCCRPLQRCRNLTLASLTRCDHSSTTSQTTITLKSSSLWAAASSIHGLVSRPHIFFTALNFPAASWSRLRSVVCDRLNSAIIQHRFARNGSCLCCDLTPVRSARAVFSSERTAMLYGCQVLLENYMRGSANHVIRQKARPISDESWQKSALASIHSILDVCMSSTQELISMHRFQWEAVKWGLSDHGVALSKCIGCPFDVSVDMLAADGSVRRTLSV